MSSVLVYPDPVRSRLKVSIIIVSKFKITGWKGSYIGHGYPLQGDVLLQGLYSYRRILMLLYQTVPRYHRWTRNPRRHSCTRSSAAISTTATACCTVSAMSCCRSYRSFRTRPHEWWREQGSWTISPRCFANFTGCQSANALGSSWRWSPTSVYMGWRHRIWLTTVYWSLLWPADGTWDRRTPGSWSFGEHELLLAPEISRSPALSSGTRYLQMCESRHCLRRRLPDT